MRRAFARPGRASGTATLTEGRSTADLLGRESTHRRVLAFADAVAAAGVLIVTMIVGGARDFRPWMLLAIPLMVLVNKVGGLYDRDEAVLRKSTLDEAPVLMQISGLFVLILWIGHRQLLPGVTLGPRDVLEMWLVALGGMLAGRAVARGVSGRLTAPERCLVIGDARSIATVTRKIAAAPVNATVVATVPLDRHERPVDTRTFRKLAVDHSIHRAIVAPTRADGADTLELIRIAKNVGVRVSVLPRLCEVVGSSVEFDDIEGLTMLGMRRFGLSRSSLRLKRALDLAGSTVMLVAVAPLMFAIALAVRLDSRGPIFFRQTRVGRDGARFEILKFRSMVADAEDRKEQLRHLNETTGLFKIAGDPRVTRVGRLLRASSLDELPQLLNVWRGEMSLVGPRPLVVDEDAMVEGLHRTRLQFTPGMTGHWQILGSGRVPLEEMVNIDYLYATNWSLWTDMKILLRTVPYVLQRRGL